ncbi:hypothetical protein [Brenneria populi]
MNLNNYTYKVNFNSINSIGQYGDTRHEVIL